MRLELDAGDLATLADMVAERVASMLRPPVPSGKPLTADEVAERLGICSRSVRHMAARGKIARIPGTARFLVPEQEVERLLAGKG